MPRPTEFADRSIDSWWSLSREAFAEAWADCRHDARAAGSVWLRLRVLAGMAAAFLRILGAVVWSGEGSSPFGSLGRDVAVGVRRLRRAPIFAIFSIVSLAIGIGGTTAIYAITRAVIGPPEGVRNLDRLVMMTQPGSGLRASLSWPDFEDYRHQQHSFDRTGAWFSSRFALTTDSRAVTSLGEIVTGEYFEALGITPEVGRLLEPSDDQPAAAPAVVLSDDAWRRLFDGDAAVTGRPILVNGHPFTIVGVAPRPFRGLTNNGLIPADAWVSLAQALSLDPSIPNRTDRTRSRLWVFGLIRPDVSLASAQAEASGIAAQLDRAEPAHELLAMADGGRVAGGVQTRRWGLSPLATIVQGDAAGRALANLLMASVLLVLMVACTNLANLTLARSADRQRDIAVRFALGASRWRLAREAVIEAAALASTGGLASLLVARAFVVWLTRDVVVHGAGTVRLEPKLDLGALAIALGATTLALGVIGVAPSWRSARTNVQAAIAGGGHSGALLRWRGRRLLIIGQVAVSVVLVVLAALCASHLAEETRRDAGFDRAHLAVVQVDFDQQHFSSGRAQADVDAIVGRLSQLPHVEGVTVTSGLPAGLETSRMNVRADSAVVEKPIPAAVIFAAPSLLQTIRVPVIRGRGITERDGPTSAPVALVSEAVALRLFATSDALGRTVVLGDSGSEVNRRPTPETRLIVGVVRDTDDRPALTSDRGTVYVPLAQHYFGRLAFVTRSSEESEAMVGRMRAALTAVDPALSVVDSRTGEELAGADVLYYRVVTWLATLLGGFAIVIALAGLYGVLAHLVAKRTREIGVRMALGAARADVVRLVLGDGVRPVAVGIALGLSAGALLRMAAQPMFSRLVPPIDLTSLIVVPALLLAAGLAACYLPARRASLVDPNIALREP